MLVGIAVLATAGAIAIPVVTPGGGSCDLNATTSTFAAQVAAATAGQTVCLASGSYGSWAGVNKSSPGITIREQDGATATFTTLAFTSGPGPNIGWFTLDGIDYTGGGICAPAHDITIRNATQTGYFQVNPGAGPGANNSCTSAPQMNGSNIVWDNVTFTLSSCPTGSCLGNEGRLSFVFNSTVNAGVTVRNSTFTGNCADGVQFVGSGRGVTIGPGNTFTNLLQGSCAPHVDSAQFVGGCCVEFVGNFFNNNDHGIVAFDGAPDDIIVRNNVFNQTAGANGALCLGGGDDHIVEHNTFRAPGALYLCVDHSSDPSTRYVWRNNIQHENPTVQGGSGYAAGSPNYNLCTDGATCAGANSLNGTPTFVGGASPTTYAGFALAPGSLGKGAASDGTDIGVNP